MDGRAGHRWKLKIGSFQPTLGGYQHKEQSDTISVICQLRSCRSRYPSDCLEHGVRVGFHRADCPTSTAVWRPDSMLEAFTLTTFSDEAGAFCDPMHAKGTQMSPFVL